MEIFFKMRKSIYFLHFAFFISLLGFSQEKRPAVTIPSANELNLGLFGEMQVSMYSGLPEIGVPIYTVQTKNYSIPITLNYHASGIRPETHPSWVGLGWSLNAGGSITRIVKGFPDESQNTASAGSVPLGYYYSHANNTRSDWPDICQTSVCNTSFTTFLKQYNLNNLLTDYSPDEFLFNFPGHSGKFFLDDARNWQVQCDKPVKVEFDGQFITPFAFGLSYLPGYSVNGSKPFKTFTITDEMGVKYVFGEDASCIEYSDVLVQNDGEYALPGSNLFATSWQLKRIISPDEVDVVEFAYDRGPFQCYLYKAISSSLIVASQGGFFNPQCAYNSASFAFGGKITSPVYLKSITHARQNLKIDFSTSPSTELSYTHTDYANAVNEYFNTTSYDDNHLSPILDYFAQIPYFMDQYIANNNENPFNNIERRDRFIWFKLDKISITNSQTKTNVKSIVFNYSNASNQRLRLGSINLKDANESTAQTYSFEYNTQNLPAYLASRCDHWGFNNNAGPLTNADLNNLNIYYATRGPNPTFAKAEMLEKITYPTGGKTTFEYEQHEYAKVVNREDRTQLDNLSGTAGGLRVQKITTNDKFGHDDIREYFYVTGYNSTVTNPSTTLTSSGILDVLPKYGFATFQGLDINNNPFSYAMFSSNPIIPLTLTSSGQHISYSEVVERRSDGAYTIYKFTNHDNGHADVNAIAKWNRDFVPYLPYSSRDFERGRLLAKFVYDKTDKLIQSEEYEFSRLGNDGVRSVQQDYKYLCSESPTRQYVSRAAYSVFYYPFVITKKTTKTNKSGTGNDYLINVQDFTYQNKLVKTIVTTDSKGQELKTENFYPANFLGSAVYNLMVQKNMLSYPIQIDESRGGVLKKRNKVEFKEWTTGKIYPEYFKEQIENNSIQTSLQINNYDDKGNILTETPRNGTNETFLWGNNKTQLIAEVKNASNSDVAYTSFERNENTTWQFSKTSLPIADYNAPTGRKAYSLTNGYIYKKLLDGNQTYIVSYWSKNGSQQVNGVLGTAGRTVGGYTYYQHTTVPTGTDGIIVVFGSGMIDELRLYPKDARMMTYTYDPLIGLTAKCDVNNVINYYEYDAFGRLILIRDQDRNILKKACYNYEGQTENCAIQYFYNEQKSKTLSPSCPIGYASSVINETYTVPANVYQSTISLEAANQLAQADVDMYSQIFANSSCKQIVNVQFEYELTSFYEDEYTYVEYWDVFLRFYGLDPYTTIALENDLNIKYRIFSAYNSETFTVVAAQGTNEYPLGNFEAIYIDPYINRQLIFEVLEVWW